MIIDLSPLTKQELFDKMVLGLNSQKAFASVNGACKYRTDTGLKCAVGQLLPDDDEDLSHIENNQPTAVVFVKATNITEEQAHFLQAAQWHLHDRLVDDRRPMWDQAKFERAVADFAHDAGLTNPLFAMTEVGRCGRYTDDGESFVQFITYKVDGQPSDEAITDWVARKHPSDYCKHEHDCCGQYYPRNASWVRVDPEFITVTQWYYCNI